jgi:hypothetical protein
VVEKSIDTEAAISAASSRHHRDKLGKPSLARLAWRSNSFALT